MIVAVTYGDKQYDLSCKLNLWTARKIGRADKIMRYSREDIDSDYLEQHKDIFSVKRGGGLWLWKPYIILDALSRLSEDDYLMYLDSGAYYVNSIRKLVNQLEYEKKCILFSSSILLNKEWCKKSLMDSYLDQNELSDFMNRSQAEPGYILIKKCQQSMQFVEEWLSLQENYENVCDVVDKSNEYPFFKEHRHDQSTLNIVMFKHGLRPNKGFSGRSEYKYYVKFKDGEFFGYSKEELIELAAKECNQDYYKMSNYGRIVINTRIDTTNVFTFTLRLIKKTLMVLLEDSVYKYIANYKMGKYKNRISRNNEG